MFGPVTHQTHDAFYSTYKAGIWQNYIVVVLEFWSQQIAHKWKPKKSKAINGTYKIDWWHPVIKGQYKVIKIYHSEGHWCSQETETEGYWAPKPKEEKGNTISQQ